MTEDIERQVIALVAAERTYRPISSVDGKLKRRRPKLAQALGLDAGERFDGERAYARCAQGDQLKARTIREAIDQFAEKYKRHGKILNGLIEEKREDREVHVYFGMQDGCRLTEADYVSVLTSLGFTDATARKLYPELIEVSRKMARKGNGSERSVLVG